MIELRAPSRLHFGMLSFGQPDVRQFGGAGAMVDLPGLHLQITRAAAFHASGLLADRVHNVAQRFADAEGLAALPACDVEIVAVPPQHTGLGVGTSLSLSVVYGLRRFLELPDLAPGELARQAGRGRRSAVGTYGFLEGGLIVEAGKFVGELLAPQIARVELPASWRFVLIGGQAPAGISGSKEKQAFATLPPVPPATTAELCGELLLEMIPAAHAADFSRLSSSICRYGHLAGGCFAAAQGGSFAHPNLERLVRLIRELGVAGVGQTSWGPTLFALVPDEAEAQRFAATLIQDTAVEPAQITIAAPNNCGVQVSGVI